jgi:hypothetical protein
MTSAVGDAALCTCGHAKNRHGQRVCIGSPTLRDGNCSCTGFTTEPVGDAAALTDDEFQAVMNGIAHLPCADAGICQEPDPRAVIESIIAERVTTARAQAWDEGQAEERRERADARRATPDNPFVTVARNPYRSTENTGQS